MNQKNKNFRYLVEQACSAISLPYLAVKEKYKGYPVCIIRYEEKGDHLDYIEVSFDTQDASLTFIMNKEYICVSASICFYDSRDETLFIISLRAFSKYYSYRKKCWVLKDGFYVKINEHKGKISDTHFCFYKV